MILLDKELEQKVMRVVELIAVGCPQSKALRVHGLPPDWLARVAKDYPWVGERVAWAELAYESKLREKIEEASDWKAAAWLLERRERADYAPPTSKVEASGPAGGPLQVVQLSVEQALAGARGEPLPGEEGGEDE